MCRPLETSLKGVELLRVPFEELPENIQFVLYREIYEFHAD